MSEPTNKSPDTTAIDQPKTKIPCEVVEQRKGSEKLASEVRCFVRNREYVLQTKELAPNPIAVLAMQVEEGITKEEAQKRALEQGKVHGISKLSAIAKQIEAEAREKQTVRRPRLRATPASPATATGQPETEQ